MNLSFTSHICLRPIPINLLSQRLLLWEGSLRSSFDVDSLSFHKRNLASGGALATASLETFKDDVTERPFMLGYENTFILYEDGYAKVSIAMQLAEDKYDGEVYVSLSNAPDDAFRKKDLFSLWKFVEEVSASKPGMLRVVPKPIGGVLVNQSSVRWFRKVMDRKNDSISFRTLDFTPVLKTLISDAKVTVKKVNDVEKPKEPKAENPQKTIEELESRLEEYRAEIERLSVELEEMGREKRELQRSNKYISRYLDDVKEKNEKLKQRVYNAETRAKEAASGETKEFCDYFDREIKRMEAENAEKSRQITDLEAVCAEKESKLESLKGQLGKLRGGSASGFFAVPSDEQEKFAGEFGIAIFSALHKAIEKTPTKANSYSNRTVDVWESIIKANPAMEADYLEYRENKDALLNAIKTGSLEHNMNLLKSFNLSAERYGNNHWKIRFLDGDERYTGCVASTPSECESGPSNCAKDLRNAFLFPT